MPAISVKVNNHWQHPEPVANATITAGRPSPVPSGDPILINKITQANGRAEFDPKDLPDGTYKFTILPKDSWIGPVGSDVADGHPLNRIFRILELDVQMRAGVVVSAAVAKDYGLNGTVAVVGGRELRVELQPVWMKSPAHNNRGAGIDMIVIHHTDCNRQIALDTFMSEKGPHYMIDTDGLILKLVQESQASWHAGPSYWAGEKSVNANSIGIEIVHDHAYPYPEAQYKSLLILLEDLLAANSTIDPWNIVGHSDISLGDDGILGRKSGDPGSAFEWSRLERKGWGLMLSGGAFPPDAYGGFYTTVKDGALRLGDNDKTRKWGGEVRKATGSGISGQPVQELQENLHAIGYYVGTPDGGYGQSTFGAVRAIQEHFFAGGRGAMKPDGKVVDLRTAQLISGVAGSRISID